MMKHVAVTDQRLSEHQHKTVRTLQLFDAEGNSLGGCCFVEGENMYEFPIWVRDLAERVEKLERLVPVVQRHIEEYGGDEDLVAAPKSLSQTPNPQTYDKSRDDEACRCGHTYYRHFDGYDNHAPIGCKYCGCPSPQTPNPQTGESRD